MRLFKNSYVPKKKLTGSNKKYKQIIQTTPYRVSPSVDDFVEALDSAKSKQMQSRTLLYDNYIATLDTDAMVISLLNKRFGNLENKSIELVNKNNNEVDLHYQTFLNSPRFKEFIMEILNTKFWGFNVFEFNTMVKDDTKYFDYYLFPHKHINPYSQEVLKHQYDSNGISFANKQDIMMIGNCDDLGLLAQITYLSIYKRYGMFNYSRYNELAAENFTQVQASRDLADIEKQKLSEEMLSRGRGGVINTPEGVSLDFQNQSSSSQNQLFENYQKMLKEELAILILGQTMTSFDGSSRSQAEVHSDEQDSLFASDERFILNTLNFEFKSYLKYWFPEMNTADYEFKFKINSSIELAKQLTEYTKLKELGILFTDEELRIKFKDLL